MDLTFLIPVKLETQDRVRNLTTVITYLASNYDAKIIVKECDTEPRFETLVGTQLTDRIDYSFEKQTQSFFHKFLDSKFDLSLLQNSSSRKPATVGFSQVFNSYSYIEF